MDGSDSEFAKSAVSGAFSLMIITEVLFLANAGLMTSTEDDSGASSADRGMEGSMVRFSCPLDDARAETI